MPGAPVKPIGILGGTFDPVHVAHLRLAHEAWEGLALEQVRLVPNAIPPHRAAPGASAEQRLAMLQLAVADHPGLAVDERELHRPAPSYTIDTLESLRGELGAGRSLCLILGADAFVLLETWHRWQALFGAAHLVVAHRPGYPPRSWAARMGEALGEELRNRATSDPADLKRTPAGRIFALPATQLDVSATQLRALLAAGRPPRYLIPDRVLDYIEKHHLYRAMDAR